MIKNLARAQYYSAVRLLANFNFKNEAKRRIFLSKTNEQKTKNTTNCYIHPHFLFLTFLCTICLSFTGVFPGQQIQWLVEKCNKLCTVLGSSSTQQEILVPLSKTSFKSGNFQNGSHGHSPTTRNAALHTLTFMSQYWSPRELQLWPSHIMKWVSNSKCPLKLDASIQWKSSSLQGKSYDGSDYHPCHYENMLFLKLA